MLLSAGRIKGSRVCTEWRTVKWQQWPLPIPCFPQREDLWVSQWPDIALNVQLKKTSILRATEVFYSGLLI